MKCPIDQTGLVMSERQGIEIDYCPTCRGVWLDRGELDKIIERNAQAAPAAERYESGRDRDRYEDKPRRDHDDDDRHKHGKPRKKESFLGEIFDF